MAAFDYIAADAAGRTVRGSLSAVDEAAARKALAKRQLAPLQLSPGRAGAVAASTSGRVGRLSPKALALTTRQLATLISVSPLEEALRNLMLQADRPNVRRVLEGVHAGVIEGRRLSDAMGQQGAAFPPLYRAMTAAGEQSGALQPILERLADGLERDEVVRGKVLTALVYPCVLAVVALGVVVAMMTYIVPKVVDQFDSMGQTLPLLTRLVIGLSDLMRDWGWLMALVIAAVVAAGLIARRREAVRLKLDAWVLRLPLVGRLTRDLHGARMARTLSTMIAAGLPVLEGLTITARTVSNRALRRATEQMAEAVREGGGAVGRHAPRRGVPADPRLHDRVRRKQRSAGAHAGARGRLSGARILQLHRRDAQPAGAGDHRGHGRDRRRDRAVDSASHPSDQHPGSGVREALHAQRRYSG